jgi:hypothetical protein
LIYDLIEGYYAAHPALRVFHIALVPWNHVDVDMRYRLARHLANIDTDVVAIRLVLLMRLVFSIKQGDTSTLSNYNVR